MEGLVARDEDARREASESMSARDLALVSLTFSPDAICVVALVARRLLPWSSE